jgi:hypothetical protein
VSLVSNWSLKLVIIVSSHRPKSSSSAQILMQFVL